MKDIDRENIMHDCLEKLQKILNSNVNVNLTLTAIRTFADISIALSKFKEETFIKNAVKNQ